MKYKSPDKPITLKEFTVQHKTTEENSLKVAQLISACETIIKNAESIIGTEPTLMNVDVTISLRPHEVPAIDVCKSIGIEAVCYEPFKK